MNPKVVISSVVILIIVVAIVIFRNPETIENINLPLTETTQKTGNESILEEIFGGGGFGGGFGGGGGSSGGDGGGGGSGGGSGGGGSGGGGGVATTVFIGGSTTSTTIPGGNSTTTTSIPGGTSTSTTSSSTSTSTTTTVLGGSTTTSIPGGTSTSTTSSSTSTSVSGCPSNFVIDYALDCKGTTGSQDDDIYVKVTNNEPIGYTFDVFVDGTSEGQTSAAGYGTFGLRYSSIMTSWWRSQISSSSRTFNVRIEYLSGSCGMTRSVSVSFPPSSSQCGLD